MSSAAQVPIEYRVRFLENAAQGLEQKSAEAKGEMRVRLRRLAEEFRRTAADLEHRANISIHQEPEEMEMFRPCSAGRKA